MCSISAQHGALIGAVFFTRAFTCGSESFPDLDSQKAGTVPVLEPRKTRPLAQTTKRIEEAFRIRLIRHRRAAVF